jgi:hypothetical protein
VNLGTITDALVAWATAGAPSATVYYGEPNGPRPSPPAVRLKLIGGPTTNGLDAIVDVTGDPNDFNIIGERELTLSVTCIGPTALQMASDLQTSLSDPAPQQALSDAGLTSLHSSDLRDVSAMVDTKWEQRCQFDVELMSTEIKVTTPGVIESISGTGTVTGSTSGTINIPLAVSKS